MFWNWLSDEPQQTSRQSPQTAAQKGKKISWIFDWIFNTHVIITRPECGPSLLPGHGSLSLLSGLSLVYQLPQVLADGRWLLVDHSTVRSFYVNVIGWWVGFLQEPRLMFSYHLVQEEYYLQHYWSIVRVLSAAGWSKHSLGLDALVFAHQRNPRWACSLKSCWRGV